MIGYRVKLGAVPSTVITPVTFDRTTGDSVWINRKRRPRHGSRYSYFDTWGEARVAIVGSMAKNISNREIEVSCMKAALRRLLGLEPPKLEGE